MNASRMRRDGRKAFCPEDTPEEHLKRVGRNLYGFGLQCFAEGWYEEQRQYEKSLIKSDYVDPEVRILDLETQLLGMKEVLKEAIKIVEANADLDADLGYKNNQGSEHREFDYGTYCGRTAFANQLYLMLTE
tara:strand:- start:15408 stop:15803 length:396 start_codon:yes stop_codon:yes gene_type:complete